MVEDKTPPRIPSEAPFLPKKRLLMPTWVKKLTLWLLKLLLEFSHSVRANLSDYIYPWLPVLTELKSIHLEVEAQNNDIPTYQKWDTASINFVPHAKATITMHIGYPNYIYKQLEASDLKDGLLFIFMLWSLYCHLFIMLFVWSHTYMELNAGCSQNMSNFPKIYWVTDLVCNSKALLKCVFFRSNWVSYLNFNTTI